LKILTRLEQVYKEALNREQLQKITRETEQEHLKNFVVRENFSKNSNSTRKKYREQRKT
jgi:hypothetical protein